MHNTAKIIGKLSIRVIYDVSGTDTSAEELEYLLKAAGKFLNDNGLLTQEADAIVDDCKIEATATKRE
jgi:hypothetical protein